MIYAEREAEFLKELTALTHKYKIYISGCGCCGSPRLDDIKDGEMFAAKVKDASKPFGCRFDKVPYERVEYHYEDELEFGKLKKENND